jgi:hypothetical protein
VAYSATVIPVMIACPGDVHKERGIAREELHHWNYVYSPTSNAVLMPAGWDTHSSAELSGRPQELINKRVLAQCDLLVGIFWTRIGTYTGQAPSGSVEEIQRHVEAGKPAMVYFSTAPASLETIDRDQWERLQGFKTWCRSKGLVFEYDHPEHFRIMLSRQLPSPRTARASGRGVGWC